MMNISDNIRGALVGLAVGDALGAAVEFSQPWEFEPVTEMRSGGPFDLPKGYWTDDTSMALCLADSLLECHGYNSYDVMEKYHRWWTEGYRSSIGFCFDIGGQIQAALGEFSGDGGGWISKDTARSDNAGNGAIMRLAPVVIAAYQHRTPQEIIAMARVSARETHYSYEAEAATEVFAALLYQAIRADRADEVLDIAQYSTGGLFDDVAKRIHNPGELSNSGYIIHSLQVALWALQSHKTFRDGMLAVVNLGGDADTNGAIFGQLAGAFYGYNAIPAAWKKDLFQEKSFVDLADELVGMTDCPILTTRFEEDEGLYNEG